jgi:hypothetical protein
MLILLISFIFYIHTSGGNRTIHYGPTLRNQINIVSRVNSFNPKSPVYVDVDNLKMFPHSLRTLQFLYGKPEELRKDYPVKRLNITYKNKDKTGWIVLDIADIMPSK